MSLDTVIHAGFTLAPYPRNALVLMGGGARTAYQVGVLQALSAMLRLQPQATQTFPFQILVGTSAGALNTTFLAGCATAGLQAFDRLAQFWEQLRSDHVYALNVSSRIPWSGGIGRFLAALSLSRQALAQGAILDNMPLVDTLHRAISLPAIEEALRSGTIEVLAVTASSYTSGVHWTFCHTAHDAAPQTWIRPGRRAEFQPITIEHLIASSAIPFLFPATPLWVDGRREFFGDGSMRQVSPLSPAMHLGAQKVLVVGVGQPQRSSLVGTTVQEGAHGPTLGSIAGHAMASVFHDTLQADVEQAQRVTKTMKQLPRELVAGLSYRSVDVLSIQPSQSLDALAQVHAHELPARVRRALGGLGASNGGGAALASYLLFEPGFVQALMALGAQDAYARKGELLAFFAGA
ncbi:MAG: patatin-like phospholipase family protein [Parasulfuritortus sp.]|nr:patatin-like phospholipase family protein [Parasulfuritortus sp.]